MPKNTNILLIRHAEKPDSGTGLSVPGQERAQAYVIYFQNYLLDSNLVELDYLFAAANSDDSHRPFLTIQPFAAAIGLNITSDYKDTDYQNLANDILQNSMYDQSNILICWHHSQILDLAAALGSGPPLESPWPSGWPGHVFGWLLQLCYDHHGKIDLTQTGCINQKLMYNDHGKNPPAVAKKRHKQSEQVLNSPYHDQNK